MTLNCEIGSVPPPVLQYFGGAERDAEGVVGSLEPPESHSNSQLSFKNPSLEQHNCGDHTATNVLAIHMVGCGPPVGEPPPQML